MEGRGEVGWEGEGRGGGREGEGNGRRMNFLQGVRGGRGGGRRPWVEVRLFSSLFIKKPQSSRRSF